MTPLVRLKLGAVLFTVFWIAGMLWWNGSFERSNLIITTVFGAAAGYFWYRFMRRRLSPPLPLPSEQSTDSEAKP
jgi:multisubunit Na+/H+ antiporter MnhE subunit